MQYIILFCFLFFSFFFSSSLQTDPVLNLLCFHNFEYRTSEESLRLLGLQGLCSVQQLEISDSLKMKDTI